VWVGGVPGGRFACGGLGAGAPPRPYLVPLAYGYDGAAVYAHSSLGRKIRLMRHQPLVAFEVDAAEAPDRWRSVIADGVYEEIVDPAAQERALRVIYPPPAALPALPPETIVYRLRLTAKSGRFETPDDSDR
jgi:nitroimidazol reductase NimA-like FMN-containing flavoprotein (pyridoxamine 5'-phosphate oxidase superfamily)